MGSLVAEKAVGLRYGWSQRLKYHYQLLISPLIPFSQPLPCGQVTVLAAAATMSFQFLSWGVGGAKCPSTASKSPKLTLIVLAWVTRLPEPITGQENAMC